jgi:type IV secretory pathway VirB4 component
LQDANMLHIVNELCPTKILLSNPGGDFDQYARVFKLNTAEVERYQSLKGKGDMLVKTPTWSKVLHNNLDSLALATYSNSPYENNRRNQLIAEHGFADGLRRFAAECDKERNQYAIA